MDFLLRSMVKIRTTLPDCPCAGDAFVFASRTETQGLVLLEAMALGVPVVSTAVMGTRDIVAPERDALRAPEDEAGFAECILRLLSDSDLRSRKSDQARSFLREWSGSTMASRMVALYRGLTATGQADTVLS